MSVWRRRKEFVLCLLAVIVSAVFLLFAGYQYLFHDYLSKDQIIKLVNKHQVTLLHDIENSDYKNSSRVWGIDTIRTEGSVVYYDCGGAGFGSATSYYGFYFTPDDVPVGRELLREDSGWIYRQNQDDVYYTEKIRDCFYYFEEHY